MSKERCDLSDLRVGECGCRLHKPQPPEEESVVLRARFATGCRACSLAIEVGDLIAPGPEYGWVHKACRPE